MSRWQPDARGRLAQAALDLYAENGFERTTVAEIAQRAGLTERTFFRHYADKREVLFGGAFVLSGLIETAVAEASPDAAPFDVVVAVLDALAGEFPEDRRAHVRRRAAVIASHPELCERELIKLAHFAEALTEALRERGTPAPVAALSAETGLAVFRVAFARWIDEGEDADMPALMRETLDALRTITAPRARPARG